MVTIQPGPPGVFGEATAGNMTDLLLFTLEAALQPVGLTVSVKVLAYTFEPTSRMPEHLTLAHNQERLRQHTNSVMSRITDVPSPDLK